MPGERRYDDDEVRRIFDVASEQGLEEERTASLPLSESGAGHGDGAVPPTGLTLGELQEIGAEVGLRSDAIARAAATLDATLPGASRSRTLGLPTSVRRVIDLPRALTDEEWELVVTDLRDTFGALGELSAEGGMRQWTNGRLAACLERTPAGHRLRLSTTKESAVAANTMASVFGGMGLVMLVVFALTGRLAEDPAGPLVLLGMAVAALASNLVTLPPWARGREEQMARIAERVTALVGPPYPEA